MLENRSPLSLSLSKAVAAALLALAAPAQADVLVDNVDGLTLDASGQVERFNGLLIGDDGRIEQVLRRADKRPGSVDFKLDGKGRVLMPGMIDAHGDVMALGLSLLTADASGPAPSGQQPRPEDRDQALARAQQYLFQRGVTTVADIGTTIEAWQAYRRAGDLARLSIRIMAYARGTEAMILIGGPGPSPWLYDDRLRLNGVSLATPEVARTPVKAATKAVIAHNGETQLKNLMSRAAMDGFQVAVNAPGDKAVASVLDAIAELAETYKGERRWRIERAHTIDPADIPRFGQLGVVASMQPKLEAPDRLAAETRLGPARLAGAHAWKSLSAGGAKLAFGLDAPTGTPDPFAGMATAITRQGSDLQPFGGWQVQERLTREAAFAAYTTGAAYAGFAEGRFGRLAKGQRADFLLVDKDPMLASPAELRGMRVLQTWVGGKLVWQAKE